MLNRHTGDFEGVNPGITTLETAELSARPLPASSGARAVQPRALCAPCRKA